MSKRTELVPAEKLEGALAATKTPQQTLVVSKAFKAAASMVRQRKNAREECLRYVRGFLRAERKLGKQLKGMPKLHGGRGTPSNQHQKEVALQNATPPTYADLGIQKTQAHRAQVMARLSDTAFHKWFAEEADKGYYPTAQGLYVFANRGDADAANQPDPPAGKYGVIVCDPPWPMKKIERDEEKWQGGFDYPTMSLQTLRDFSIVADAAATDCHLFLWTTHKFLPDGVDVLKAWKFKYVLTFVWHKPGGFQPFGLPQYNCEFCLYARRGAPTFTSTKAFPVCFEAPRGKHSEKPQEFYDMVRRVTDGKRLDVFSRRQITGFKGWGNESPNGD